MLQLGRIYQSREGNRRLLPLKADAEDALVVQAMQHVQRGTNILMLTGSSRASEVAKEKGSMADIHLPQNVL
jgi:hypothetical protein